MRRGFSIFLILMFGLGLLSTVLSATEDANLPACCRRHGSHHCAMALQMRAAEAKAASSSTPSVTAPATCPLFPGFTTGPLTPARALTASGISLPGLLAQRRELATLAADAPIQPIRPYAGRGPPNTDPI